MKIEAVTVSVNFSDYLIHCVGNNRHFDRWVIVTTEDDKDTIKVCKDNGLEYIFTDSLYTGEYTFAKGRAINDGLRELDRSDWLVHLDSDIVLPDNTREVIEKTKLRQKNLYGLQGRHMAYAVEDLEKNVKHLPFRRKTLDQNERPEERHVGFFQMWHSSVRKEYRQKSGSAFKDDIGFRRKWKKENRGVIKIKCIHLGERKVNWHGRKAKKFS
tara:strand:- start:1478 stop:2119 length:642 start_codon:yes stop_codon:yes gene_type:complete